MDTHTETLIGALAVLTTTPHIRRYLAQYDPKALGQADRAIAGAAVDVERAQRLAQEWRVPAHATIQFGVGYTTDESVAWVLKVYADGRTELPVSGMDDPFAVPFPIGTKVRHVGTTQGYGITCSARIGTRYRVEWSDGTITTPDETVLIVAAE